MTMLVIIRETGDIQIGNGEWPKARQLLFPLCDMAAAGRASAVAGLRPHRKEGASLGLASTPHLASIPVALVGENELIPAHELVETQIGDGGVLCRRGEGPGGFAPDQLPASRVLGANAGVDHGRRRGVD
jgi:hypothetical protein